MRLHKRDMLFLSHHKHGDMVATVGQLGIQRLDLVPHNEANAAARSRDKADPFSFIRLSIGTLKKSHARRVYVDEMGKLARSWNPRQSRLIRKWIRSSTLLPMVDIYPVTAVS